MIKQTVIAASVFAAAVFAFNRSRHKLALRCKYKSTCRHLAIMTGTGRYERWGFLCSEIFLEQWLQLDKSADEFFRLEALGNFVGSIFD